MLRTRTVLVVGLPLFVATFAATWIGLMAEDAGTAPPGSSFLLGAGSGLFVGGVLLPLTGRRRLATGVVLVLLGGAALLAFGAVTTRSPAYAAGSIACGVAVLGIVLVPLPRTVVRVEGAAEVRQPVEAAFAALSDPRQPAGRSRRAGAVEMDGPPAPGSRFRIEISPGRDGYWADGEIREHERPRRVVFHVVRRGAVLPTTTGYELDGAGGRTRVAAWIEARSPRVTAPLVRRALTEHLREILADLESDIG